MERTKIPDRATPSKRAGFAPAKTEYALNVALLYQDPPTLKWADQVCDQVTRLAGDNAVRCTRWEFSQLSDPDALLNSSLATMVADVIVVSIYDAKELPVNLCAWTDTWLPNRCVLMGALIALISVPGDLNAQAKPARDYLRAVARQGRMDFLLRERRLPGTSRGYFYMERAGEWAERSTSALQEAPGDGQKTYRHLKK